MLGLIRFTFFVVLIKVNKWTVFSLEMFKAMTVRTKYFDIIVGVIGSISIYMVYAKNIKVIKSAPFTHLTFPALMIPPPVSSRPKIIISGKSYIRIILPTFKKYSIGMINHLFNRLWFVFLTPKRVAITGFCVALLTTEPYLIGSFKSAGIDVKFYTASLTGNIRTLSVSFLFTKLHLNIGCSHSPMLTQSKELYNAS